MNDFTLAWIAGTIGALLGMMLWRRTRKNKK